MSADTEPEYGTMYVHIDVDTSRFTAAMKAVGDAARKLTRTWTTYYRCTRCHARGIDPTGVDPSLCTACEHRAAVRATAIVGAVMALLTVAMIMLGRIG